MRDGEPNFAVKASDVPAALVKEPWTIRDFGRIPVWLHPWNLVSWDLSQGYRSAALGIIGGVTLESGERHAIFVEDAFIALVGGDEPS